MSTITQAASVLLAASRRSEEVFLVSRALTLRFMGGFVAFPGGKVHQDDSSLAQAAGLSVHHVAAVRELFEETGVLLAHSTSGDFPPASNDLNTLRRELLEEKILFAPMLERLGLHLESADLKLAGHLVTPPFAPVRFDTAFFVADLPAGQRAEIWPGELTAGAFATAAAALAQWRQGHYPLSPPTLSILELIENRAVEELPERLRPALDSLDAGKLPAIWFSPAVLMIPLDCQGLPPTTHTNCFLIGTGPVYLVDPGPTDAGEQEKLFDALAGRRFDAVVLTHHHPDHIGAARVCAERYRVPILAHPRTAELLRGRVAVDGFIEDGDQLDLGEAPHGRGRWSLCAIHTPGHAPGHLAFYEPDYQLLFAADMLSSLSSIIISPHDGNLKQYLDSLRRLSEYPVRLLLPAHGPPTLRAAHAIEEALAHRATREQQLLEVMAQGPQTIDELVQKLYRGFSPAVLKWAALQVESGLIKLQDEGTVRSEANRWLLS